MCGNKDGGAQMCLLTILHLGFDYSHLIHSTHQNKNNQSKWPEIEEEQVVAFNNAVAVCIVCLSQAGRSNSIL
jgi:hypothetical protein